MSTLNRVTRGEKLLNALVNDKVLSPAGKCWLIRNVDPFHDHALQEECGYPDPQVGRSNVMNVTKRFTIKSPDGNPFDASVVFYPLLYGQTSDAGPFDLQLLNYTRTGQVLTPTSGGAQMAPIVVYSGAPGTPLGPATAGSTQMTIGLDSNLITGPCRLIACGFEITNTTPELFKGGSIAYWRQNTGTRNPQTYTYLQGIGSPTTEIHMGAFSGTHWYGPPRSLAEVQALPNTVVNSANDGAYIVCAMNSQDNPAKNPGMVQPVIDYHDGRIGDSADDPAYPVPCYAGGFGAGGVFTSTLTPLVPLTSFSIQPYHMCGCFISAQQSNATFDIVVKFTLEFFPSPDEQQLVYVTKPSASYDPVALTLADSIMLEMPVGVPVKENPLGEWFFDAVKTGLEWLGVVPHPIAQTIATVGKGALPWVQSNFNDVAKINMAKSPQKINADAQKAFKQEAQKQVKKEVRKEIVKAVKPTRVPTKTVNMTALSPQQQAQIAAYYQNKPKPKKKK